MTAAVTVGAPRQEAVEGWPTVSATITIEGKPYDIYYRCSQGPLTATADPFLPVALLPAMSIAAPLHMEGEVSPSLLAHVDQIQDILSVWYKTLTKVPVEVAGVVTQTVPEERGVGCFFSGGIDSFYSVLKHRDEIGHLIFVHGWDIPLSEHATRATVSGRVRQAAAELGKPLLEIETNARSLLDAYTEWNKESHGAGIGSAALTLPLQFSKIFIAATCAYDEMIPHGSHALLDPLWGTDRLQIVHDGGERQRWQKLEHIMNEDIVHRYLRSCWHQQAGQYNCCSCHSCLSNMAFLQLHGVLDQFPVYDQPIDLDKLSHLTVSAVSTNRSQELLLELAEQKGTCPEITQALRTALSFAPKYPQGPDALYEMQLLTNNLREQMIQTEARVYVLEQQKYQLQQQMQQPNEQAKQLTEQLQAQRARVAQLEAQLYRLTSSASWRATAPLRLASEAWRGVRRGRRR